MARVAVVGGLVGMTVMIFGQIGGFFTSVPFTTDEQMIQYAAVTEAMQLEVTPAALIAVDAVRFQQDFSQVTDFTMAETVRLFAICMAPRPFLIVTQNEYETEFTVHRPTSVSWALGYNREIVTVRVMGEGGTEYPEGSVLGPGTYRILTDSKEADTTYRVLIELASVNRCGPEEVERVMDDLNLLPDDRSMVLNIMASLTSGELFFFKPNPHGPYTWPIALPYPITSRFGYRLDPVTGGWAFHTGVDIGADSGEPVLAAAKGVVQFAGLDGNYGNVVRIEHLGDLRSAYAHLEAPAVTVGQSVHEGDVIGYVGSTGKSTGPHLHFEWLVGGTFIDPLEAYR